MKSIIVAGALVAFAGVAVAGNDPFPRRFKPDQFPQVVEIIEINMAPDGEYPSSPEEQQKVRALLGEIGEVLEGNERLADLDTLEKAAIDKRRTEINAILLDNAPKEVAGSQESTGKRKRSAASMLESRPATSSGL